MQISSNVEVNTDGLLTATMDIWPQERSVFDVDETRRVESLSPWPRSCRRGKLSSTRWADV